MAEFADVIALLEKPFELICLGPCHFDMTPKADIEITMGPFQTKTEIAAFYSPKGMRYGAHSRVHFVSYDWLTYNEPSPKRKTKINGYMQNVLQNKKFLTKA